MNAARPRSRHLVASPKVYNHCAERLRAPQPCSLTQPTPCDLRVMVSMPFLKVMIYHFAPAANHYLTRVTALSVTVNAYATHLLIILTHQLLVPLINRFLLRSTLRLISALLPNVTTIF